MSLYAVTRHPNLYGMNTRSSVCRELVGKRIGERRSHVVRSGREHLRVFLIIVIVDLHVQGLLEVAREVQLVNGEGLPLNPRQVPGEIRGERERCHDGIEVDALRASRFHARHRHPDSIGAVSGGYGEIVLHVGANRLTRPARAAYPRHVRTGTRIHEQFPRVILYERFALLPYLACHRRRCHVHVGCHGIPQHDERRRCGGTELYRVGRAGQSDLADQRATLPVVGANLAVLEHLIAYLRFHRRLEGIQSRHSCLKVGHRCLLRTECIEGVGDD